MNVWKSTKFRIKAGYNVEKYNQLQNNNKELWFSDLELSRFS